VSEIGIGIPTHLWLGVRIEGSLKSLQIYEKLLLFSKYSKAADNLREKILSNYYNGHKAKDVFLEKISKIIGD